MSTTVTSPVFRSTRDTLEVDCVKYEANIISSVSADPKHKLSS